MPNNHTDTYTEVQSLYNAAIQLRRDAHEKHEQALQGKLAATGLRREYLVAKTHNLLQMAFAVETYTMWVQGNPPEITHKEVQTYLKLIEAIRNRLP
jgi:hypothetical protein